MTRPLPWLIVAAVFVLIVANVIEFRAKRRADRELVAALESGGADGRLRAARYRQGQNIEQLLHIVVTLLFANLVATLWT